MTFKRMIEKSSLFLFMVLTLFIFRSKSAIDISHGLLLVFSIIYMIRHADREWLAQNRYLLVLLLPLAIGFCISFFSMSGPVKGAAAFLERYRFFLMIIPFTLFIRSERTINILFVLMNLSASVAVIYGISQMNFPDIWGRAIGFYPILRESCLLMSVGLINLVGLFCYRPENRTWNIVSKTLIGVNTLLVMAAVLLMMRRGVYLGFVAGVFAFLLTLKKKKILFLIVIALCASFYFSNTVVTQRIKSIVDFKNDNSNRERIQLFRTGFAYIVDEGLFFHGTGGKMSVEPYTEYFYSHPPEYEAKNIDIVRKQYFGNFHNSFLQMAVEYGLFFALCYLVSIIYMLVRLYRSLPYLEGNRKVYPIAAIVVTSGFFVSQFFHTDLYSYGGIPFLLAFAAGCLMANQHRTQSSKNAPEDIANATVQNDGH